MTQTTDQIIDIKKMDNKNFQTPEDVCQFIALLLDFGVGKILEPTPGVGNLVKVLKGKGRRVTAPKDFFTMKPQKFDAVVMNPPFTPMQKGYEILFACMKMAPEIVALMPWLTIINSEKRLKAITEYGLRQVIHLPRSIFPGSRVQTCILHLQEDYLGETKFDWYER